MLPAKLLWLTCVLAEIQGKAPSVLVLKVDNKSAIVLIKKSSSHRIDSTH
jgi:hypothetical protein